MKTLCRKCIATNKIKSLDQLIRVVKTKENKIYINSKVLGRGAYITKEKKSIEHVIKNKLLNRAFKQVVSSDIYQELKNFLEEGDINEKR